MKSEYVLLDFDGVIADTFELSLNTTRRVYPGDTETAFRQRLHGDTNQVLQDIAATGTDFFAAYSRHIMDQSPIKGMADMLEYLSENFTIIIVSSTTSEPIKKFLRHYQLLQFIDAIFSNDVPTPKAVKFETILQHYKIKPKESVFVTDTLGDIKEANKVNIPSIAVTWGYHDEETLRQGEPFTIIEDPAQLKGAIEEAFEFSGEYDED